MNPAELPLRDIHLPEPIGWWPPAPGWWLAAILFVGAVILLVSLWRRRIALRRSTVFIARGELQSMQDAWHEHGDARRLISDVSVWLRRVSMSLRTRKQAASLTGRQWWRYLDELAGTPVFGPDGGRLIGEAPYRAAVDPDEARRALSLCERWLNALSETRRGVPS